jgi:cobalamin biosynthetic protein CobC
MLEHGGKLRAAAARYGIPLADWLDLSTGINPSGWPVPPLPQATWARLPEDEDGLTEAACSYYGTRALLPVAGSQAAIQALPQLRAPCRVAVIHPGYAEHAHAWRRAEHAVMPVAAESVDDVVSQADVLVLINPNNPTGARFPPEQLLDWHTQLAACGGWLVVDEAFMDPTPQDSLAPFAQRDGLIVLRSLGKFFGLAGARVGFVLAEPMLLERLRALLGPWAVNAPARFVATQALRDGPWQQQTRARLPRDSSRLATLLACHGLAPDGGCALFQWARASRAAAIHERLARHGVLTRLFEDPPGLRLGLPGYESHWRRLESALADRSATAPVETLP